MTIKKRIQKWLDIKKPTLEKEVGLLKKDLEFWHKTFRTFSVIPCAYCNKQMRIYPYGGAYYTDKDNRKVHAACYDEFLAQLKEGETTND